MTDYIVPCLIFFILAHGVATGTNVYSALMEGAKQGLLVVRDIFPPVLIMLTVIAMVRASGAIDLISNSLAPVVAPLGVPPECLPLALLRPFSGGGALSVGSEVIAQSGPDSLAGRIAAVMLGSSETSFYTIAVYSAYIKMKNTRYIVPAALSADLAAFVASSIAVRVLLGA